MCVFISVILDSIGYNQINKAHTIAPRQLCHSAVELAEDASLKSLLFTVFTILMHVFSKVYVTMTTLI